MIDRALMLRVISTVVEVLQVCSSVQHVTQSLTAALLVFAQMNLLLKQSHKIMKFKLRGRQMPQGRLMPNPGTDNKGKPPAVAQGIDTTGNYWNLTSVLRATKTPPEFPQGPIR